MAALTSIDGCRRALLVLASLAMCGVFFAGCGPEGGSEHSRVIDGLKADLEESKRRIDALQKSLSAKDSELAVNIEALETAKKGLSDLQQALKERDAQLVATKSDAENLKKTDVVAFAEIAATQGQGSIGLAVARYKKFITDFPKSPLVTHANNAIEQLDAVEQTSTASRTVAKKEAGKPEKDFAKAFNEGFMTLPELAPYLRKKTLSQVIALCGRPNRTYNQGTEIGYEDRAINPATGSRGILIVGFEEGVVATIRVEYAGRKMTP
jgi:hypothetical protein